MKIETEFTGARPLSPADAPLHLPYRADIDGLRAIAVLSVVLFHAFPKVLRGGFIGVDIFFVISGFLISGILLKELQENDFSFANFYARRIKRIFPALILVCAATLGFGWVALFPDEYLQLGKHAVGGAAFSANFFYWAQVGYFDTAAETKPLLHLWSLGIEEQFYIVWPAVLLLAWKRRANLLAVTAGLALLSFVANVGGIAHHATATFYSPASRAWELLLGALLACLQQGGDRPALALPRIPAGVRAGLGAALLALGLALVTPDLPFPGYVALVPVLGAVLLIGAGPQAWFNRRVLSNPVLVWVGLISYPLYLWHWPLLSFAQIVESRIPGPAIRAGAVAAAVVLAWLTYLLVERPLRRSRQRWKVALLAALMTAIAVAGGAIFLNGGLPSRQPIQDNLANQKALEMVEDKANAAACKRRYGFDTMYKYCLLAHVDRNPTVALIGDSHAFHVVAGLTRYYDSLGENLLYLGTRHPYWGLKAGDDDPYQQATQPMLELALNTPSIKTIVISTHIRLNHSPDAVPYVAAARETFRRFIAAGKHVIFMDDVPTLSFDPRSCIKRAGVASSATTLPCAIPRGHWDADTADYRSLLREFAKEFPQVEWFESWRATCDDMYCHAMMDGRLMYRDDNHLSYDGDLLVGKRFAEWRQAKKTE